MNYNIITSPIQKRKKPPAPSKKKSLGYYNEAKPTGTGAAAGGGMSRKGVAKYRADNPGSKLKTAVTTPPSKLKPGSKAAKEENHFVHVQKVGQAKEEERQGAVGIVNLKSYNMETIVIILSILLLAAVVTAVLSYKGILGDRDNDGIADIIEDTVADLKNEIKELKDKISK